jgi:hypothetical protein
MLPLGGVTPPARTAFLLDPNEGYSHQITGVGGAPYNETVFGPGLVAALHDVPQDPGVSDLVSVRGAQAMLAFRTGSPQKPLDVEMRATTAGGEQRSVRLRGTSFGNGGDTLSFDGPRRSVSYAHQGPAAAFQFTLTASGVGSAGSFESEPLRIGDGESATIAPSSWSDLGSALVELTLMAADGRVRHLRLRNLARQPAELEIERLEAERMQAGFADLEAESEIDELAPGSLAVITFAVLDAQRQPVATRSITVPAGDLREGRRTDHWRFGPAPSGRYQVAVAVQVVAPDGRTATRSALRDYQVE